MMLITIIICIWLLIFKCQHLVSMRQGLSSIALPGTSSSAMAHVPSALAYSREVTTELLGMMESLSPVHILTFGNLIVTP